LPGLVNESNIALQICTAGNLRTALLTAALLDRAGQPERLLIATDTPTGSGIMPLGMFYTISHLASLGGMPPEQAIAAATGNNAMVYRLNSGFLKAGRDADVVQKRCAIWPGQRRYSSRRGGRHRRRAPVRRSKPQYAGDNAQREDCRMPVAEGLFWRGTLS
jgi:hypothetical protein